MKYRKKPIVIEARQYTPSNRDDLIAWIKDEKGDVIHKRVDDEGAEYEVENLELRTLEGTHFVQMKDWVIKGIKGEFYPCKPDIFEATYEEVKD